MTVRHPADVEHRSVPAVLVGQDAPPLFSSPSDPDGDSSGTVPDTEAVARAREARRAEVAFAGSPSRHRLAGRSAYDARADSGAPFGVITFAQVSAVLSDMTTVTGAAFARRHRHAFHCGRGNRSEGEGSAHARSRS
ncbi:hypothetical protein [Streptomyces sp. NPDC007264]|uniref:hypothetical protein n=1 Tax=Streptomyces sp. NPDC007264 TaxID=3364777 RepID=UPI0036DB343F